MASVRVACVGAGYFSQFHYGSWARIDTVEVVGACDIDQKRAKATGATAFGEIDAMLAATTPDILDVIVPPPAHASTIRSAFAAGIKWIICQKPFCTSLSEALDILDEADKHGATIVIHENFRFQPWYRHIKTVVEQGFIGAPLQATFRLRPGDGQGDDAYLARQPYFQKMPKFLVHETAVHWVDTFRFLFGNPTTVYADLRRINPVITGEDAGVILFEHPNDVRATFDGNRLLDHASDNTRRTMGEALIEGTEGTLTLMGDGSVHGRRFGEVEGKCLLEADTHDGFGGDCVHHLQKHVVSAFLNGSPLENTGRDYLAVMECVDAIYRSHDLGQKISISS